MFRLGCYWLSPSPPLLPSASNRVQVGRRSSAPVPHSFSLWRVRVFRLGGFLRLTPCPPLLCSSASLGVQVGRRIFFPIPTPAPFGELVCSGWALSDGDPIPTYAPFSELRCSGRAPSDLILLLPHLYGALQVESLKGRCLLVPSFLGSTLYNKILQPLKIDFGVPLVYTIGL